MPRVDEEPQEEPAAVVPSLVADANEPPDLVERVRALGVAVERRRLAPADYVVGPIAIERKAVSDFHASIIDKRLFEQVARLKDTYATCALVLEGDLAYFEERRQPRATWGALCSVAFDFGVQLLPTPSRDATAEVLAVLARRVARDAVGTGGGGGPEVRFKPRLLGPRAEQKFAVQGLPGVGDVVSESLLEHFGSVRRVFAANERELLRVPGVGKGRAKDVTGFLDRPYEGRQRRLSE